jgi:exodeoxyribonuclease VII large subunit
MSRLPFDPGRAKGAQKGVAPPSDHPWSVSQLASAVGDAIDQTLPAKLAVLGEVSQPRESTHLYFTLKDANAGVQAVIFASTLRRMALRPEHGQQVVAYGKLAFYAPQGRVSLVVDRIEAVGRGALEQRLRELSDELRAAGWFEEARKRRPPTLPRRVAVITSLSGAALADVLDTMRRRCPVVGVLVLGVKVQGESAARQVSQALRWVSAHHERLSVDAVIVTRGGGSLEDLWAFNDRDLARATMECAVPVVAAIGHETDTTIIELVADIRAATPTQAAMRVAPDAHALQRQCAQLGDRLGSCARRGLREARVRWLQAAEDSVLADPSALVRPCRERLDDARIALTRALAQRMMVKNSRLDRLAMRLERHRPGAIHAARRERLRSALRGLRRAHESSISRMSVELLSLGRELEAVGPRSVLHRGYTCTLDAQGRAIRTAGAVRAGDAIRTVTADGSFGSVVGEPGSAEHSGEASKTIMSGTGQTGEGGGVGQPRERRSARGKAKGSRATPVPDEPGLFGTDPNG